METFTLRQNGKTATLSEMAYQPAEGFQEDNTWHVAEESLTAESDTQLEDGPATISRSGTELPVVLTVFELEKSSDEDEESDEKEPACVVEIDYADGLTKLATTLGVI